MTPEQLMGHVHGTAVRQKFEFGDFVDVIPEDKSPPVTRHELRQGPYRILGYAPKSTTSYVVQIKHGETSIVSANRLTRHDFHSDDTGYLPAPVIC